MELIIMIALVFTVISWIGGATGRSRPSSSRSFQGYSKTDPSASSPTGRTGQRTPAPTSQQLARKGRPASNTAWEKGNQNRSNNSPLRKSTFHNHEESASYLRDEIQESKVLWELNKMKMQQVNDDFNRFVEKQHQAQQRMLQESKVMDR